jgi:putative ABC transport system substrate-binding protein
MAQALVLTAIAGCVALFMQCDGIRPPPKALVLFLGHSSPVRDPTYEYFLGVVARTRPQLGAAASIEYLGLPDDDGDEAARLLTLALQRRPAALVAPYASSAIVAHRVAGSTPIVFASYIDPVIGGIVDAVQHRTTPITGVNVADWLDGKRFEILHEAYPAVKTVGVLGDAEWVGRYDAQRRIPAEAARVGLKATLVLAESEPDVRRLFEQSGAGRFDAWYVPPTYIGYKTSTVIIAQMRKWGRPCIFATTEEVTEGGLMAYAQDTRFAWAALAELTARVVAGEPAGSIPIMRPQRFVLTVRTGADTGVAPPSIAVVRRADVILR